MNSAIIIIVAFIGLFFLQMLFLISRYIKCPPNKAMVIYGRTGEGSVKALAGGAEFVWPIIQDYEFLDLTPYQYETTNTFETKDLIKIPTNLSLEYGVSAEESILKNAAERLLGWDRKAIQSISNDIIGGTLHRTFSDTDIIDIVLKKDKFLYSVSKDVSESLSQIGIQLINIKMVFNKNKDDYMQELEKEFQQKKLESFDRLDIKDAQQQLNILNEKIEQNAEERAALISKKLDLLAKMK